MYPGRLPREVKFLLRYGEIGLKGRHVQGQMKRRLRRNALGLLADRDPGAEMSEKEGRLFVETDHPESVTVLSRVFGLVSFSPVWETASDLDGISAEAVRLADEIKARGPSFAVRARRVGTHPFTSADMARTVGSAILSAHPELKVNLTVPDWEVHVEVRGAIAYLFSEILPGVGGLPLGTQGKLVGLVENVEGTMASWLMMKRGSYVLPVFRTEEEPARGLRAWDPGLRLRHIDAVEDMRTVAEETGALGFVYPWTSPGGPVEDHRPAFYPLMGLDPERLEALRTTVMGPGPPTSPSPGARR